MTKSAGGSGVEAARERAEAAGQGHVFRFWDRLDAAGRERLAREVAALDFDLLERLRVLLERPAGSGSPPRLEPPDVFRRDRDEASRARAEAAAARGGELLAEGRVGFLLVAGGQASRLGYDGPKGTFPIGPLSGRSLFEMHARRLLAARRRYGIATPWYVMTSPANDEATRRFFAEHDHLGLDPAEIRFFSQDVLPALDDEGRILLAAPDRLFLAPNGHGGVLLAMASSGALDDARERGLATLSYFQVDNPLARPADPLFLGLHAEAGAGMSSKVVPKRDPGEKVGVLGRIDGRMGCIEYSDLPEELRDARDDEGELAFGAGNIAVHAIEVDFLAELTGGDLSLPWHLARKEMDVVGEDGGRARAWGTKFETFVFDALARSPESVVLEVERAEEFSPVKNADGEDSPATARRDLCALHADFVRARGGELPPPGPDGIPPVEVDPCLAETREEFVALLDPRPEIVDGGHLYRYR